MTKKIFEQFNQFIKTIDERILEFINIKDQKLTEHISGIHKGLWKNYKEINGISTGFHGISEYIVFSTFKNFIQNLNNPQKFIPKMINKDLRYFELEKNDKILKISRASKLEHIGLKSKRAPDISIVLKENKLLKPIAIIEVKNYFDKGSAKSAIEILNQVREEINYNNSKYAIFSFSKISVRDKEVRDKLKRFSENNNNSVITNETEFNNEKNIEFNIIDLSDFFTIIENEVKL